jgi:hypothetical protein
MRPDTSADSESRVKLRGADRFWYLSPAIWLAVLATVFGWSAVGAFLGDSPHKDLPLFLFMSGLFGVLAIAAQWKLRRDLRFRRFETMLTPDESYARVLGMIEARRWSLAEHKRAKFLVYYTRASWFGGRERVSVKFEQSEVCISSICDPARPTVLGRHERNIADVQRAINP